jgi:hypothetical protein
MRTHTPTAAFLSLATALTVVTTPATPADPTSLAVSKALVAAYGAGAAIDDSSVTQCMTTSPQTLAYRTDRIVLRPSPATTTTSAVNHVIAALQVEMGVGTFSVGTPETILWDAASDPGAPHFAAHPRPDRVDGDSVIWRVVAVPITAYGEHPVPVVRLARRLRSEDLLASPDYLEPADNGPLGVWPEGPPTPAPGPGVPRTGLGSGTTAVVFDTGVPAASDANLPLRLSRLTPADVEDPDRNGDHLADVYFGVHLTAIAGIFATMVPDTTVKGVRITGSNGIATEFSAAKRMNTILRAADDLLAWPDVVIAAFGSPACEVGPAEPGADMVPLGLRMVSEAVNRQRQAVVVAAAGNLGVDKPIYPAAFGTDLPAIISVGALDATADSDGNPWTSASRTAPPAAFSNYGPWVSAWTPGVGLPTYHALNLRFEPTGPTINGYAYVNGTSYAAPMLATAVVEQIARTGLSPQRAWESVRATGRACSAALGSGVGLALTAMSATSTTKADPLLPSQC